MKGLLQRFNDFGKAVIIALHYAAAVMMQLVVLISVSIVLSSAITYFRPKSHSKRRKMPRQRLRRRRGK